MKGQRTECGAFNCAEFADRSVRGVDYCETHARQAKPVGDDGEPKDYPPVRFEVIDCGGNIVDTANSGEEGGDALEWHFKNVPWGRPYTLQVGGASE